MERFAAVLVLAAMGIGSAAAAVPGDPAEKAPPVDDVVTTRHAITIDGEHIDYTAHAGTMVLAGDDGTPRATVFHIAYTRDGVDDPSTRPVTFSFNGGPGAAALWVNLGAFGPRKVLADDEGRPLPPPGRLVDNAFSVLDVTDLVFIDPVSTGFSRPADGADRDEFHGLRGDIESVGAFIRLWVTRNGRWSSPKLIAGESYGTTRAAGLADHLQSRYGMYLNGIVMISTVLNFQNQQFDVGNDMAYIIHLPTYAATAWYHGRLGSDVPQNLESLLVEVEQFALTDYALALLQGDALAPAERRRIAEQVARYTGLSADYVLRTDLRIKIWRFTKELLREQGLTVGRLDSRFTGRDRDDAGERPEFDPSMIAVSIGYETLMNDYVRRDLGFETDRVYESLSGSVRPWSWDNNDNRYVNVAESLRRAMVRNRDLHVLFTCGYYDFATPYFDTEYTVSHLGLPEELRDNVEIEHYEAGHMMYIRTADHEKFKQDVVELVERCTGPAAE